MTLGAPSIAAPRDGWDASTPHRQPQDYTSPMNIFARPEIATEVDQQKVNDILARLVLPPEIVKVDAEFGPDNSGDPRSSCDSIFERP